jgi:hypothetical protein
MATSGATLSIDIGSQTTAAAIERQGHRSPIVFGDSLAMPTPTSDESAQIGLLRWVETVRGDDEPVVAALARHLRSVADHAGRFDALTVVVPPSWGPRHFDRVTRAASAAELPPPQIISEAAAIAWRCFASATQDDTVMVCVLGQHTSHATVVQRSSDGWTRVATQPIPDATGDRIDQALVTAAGLTRDHADDLRAQIAAVRPRLASGQPTAIVVNDQPLPLKPGDFAGAARIAQDAAVAAVLDTLDAAAVDPDQLHGAVSAGDVAATIGLPEALSQHLGLPVTATADGRLAAAYGALAARTPVSPKSAGPTRRRWGFRAAYLVSPLVAAVAAGLLQWQIFNDVEFLLGPEIRRLPVDYEKLPVIFDTAAFACVGWCFLAAALGLARNLASALRSSAETGQAKDRQAGQLYAFAAIVGLALASMQGLLAQAIVGGPDEFAPPYLAASLAGAVVPALVAIIIGLTARWLTAQPAWTERLHHPTAAVVCAVTGIMAADAQSTGLPIPGIPPAVTTIVGITGGGLLGVGIAMTLVTMRSARLILAAIMGVASMIIVGTSNLHSAITIYLIAVALWWTRRGTRILLDNLPPNWWRRFVLTTEEDHQA